MCARLNYLELGEMTDFLITFIPSRRWREVKLRAFSNADHRTLRDLKDKWNTLVHAARIFPRRWRGEPTPQELFDRVLTAHTLG
ncbi:hypothetical protein DEO72_LG1g5 [Vigna unguiculata]|uniref:Myb-like domain-containing protein n=1 Tax=Vigna unguiculata TaxID=3917 RepID=A0A4D6KFC7_VIGUN|nr:hypothetical protein DEO72_LG1g5 [Vigna unguiculata]